MTRPADIAVLVFTVLSTSAVGIVGGFNIGVSVGSEAKQCATFPGAQIISSTADSCTYANAYGRATFRRNAK